MIGRRLRSGLRPCRGSRSRCWRSPASPAGFGRSWVPKSLLSAITAPEAGTRSQVSWWYGCGRCGRRAVAGDCRDRARIRVRLHDRRRGRDPAAGHGRPEPPTACLLGFASRSAPIPEVVSMTAPSRAYASMRSTRFSTTSPSSGASVASIYDHVDRITVITTHRPRTGWAATVIRARS